MVQLRPEGAEHTLICLAELVGFPGPWGKGGQGQIIPRAKNWPEPS